MIHLGAVLSGAAEQDPDRAFRVNIVGTQNLFEIARDSRAFSIFLPSSIAVYGPEGVMVGRGTPESVITRPTSSYGIQKIYAELTGEVRDSSFMKCSYGVVSITGASLASISGH